MCKASQDTFKIIGFRHPAPLQGRDAMPRVFLPASKTVKDIHAEHVVSCRAEDDKVRVASISVFRYIWKSLCPHVQIMSVSTDVCAKCEKDRQSVSSAVGNLEKTTYGLAAFTLDMQNGQAERAYYQEATKKAHADFSDHHPVLPPPTFFLTILSEKQFIILPILASS